MHCSRRSFLMGSLALPALGAKKKPAPVKPNVLLLVAHRLPTWMLGCYGNKEVNSPNIDRLSRTGTRFLNHFACAPEPGPGYATLITGRTPMQLASSGGIAAADVTLEGLFSVAGYAAQSLAAQPSSDATAAAVKFLDQQAAGKPFFLSVQYTDLEPPYASVPSKFVDVYAAQPFENYSREPAAANARFGKDMLADRIANLRKVAGGISAIDASVQTLIAKLYQKQAVDHTLVILTATCGALLGRRGLWGASDASEPPNMFDESTNTPMMWSWPGHVPAEAVQVELFSAYDLAPTLCDVIEVTAPARNLCGRSYITFATGKPLPKKQRWRSAICASDAATDMARVARYKLVRRNDGKGPNELYDLGADAGERANLAEDGQYITVKTSLEAEIAKWKQRYSA